MTDTPSSILLLRLQSLGSNVNLWGGYLNVAMQMLEQAAKGYQSYALTVDVTISWANYTLANTAACAVLKLTGTLTAAKTMTLPGYMNFLLVKNSAGQSVTIKCSGGTGITIPNNRQALLFCDGVDYYSATPDYLPTATTLTNDQDLVSKLQMTNAISVLAGVIAGGLVLNSVSDPGAGYLGAKLAVTSSGPLTLTASTTNPGAVNEKTTIAGSVTAMAFTEAAEQTAGFTAVAGSLYPVNIATSGTILFPAAPANKDKVAIVNYGAGNVTYNWNSLKYQGATTSVVSNAKGASVFMYTNATTGWVEL